MSAAAILLAGHDGNTSEGYAFYANDLWLWRELLEAQFGVPRGRISMLYTGGGNVSTSTPKKSFQARPASREGLTAALAAAAEDLGEQDPFFLIVSNHGVEEGLLLRGWQILSPEQLHQECEVLRSKRQLFVFGQCHAGLFLPLATQNRAVLTACMADQKTAVRKDDDHGRLYQWIEFLYDLALVLGGDPPAAATAATFAEAFEQVRAGGMRRREGKDGELPQIDDPGGIAASLRRLGA